MYESLDQLVEEKKKFDALLKERGEAAVKTAFKDFLAAFPQVKGLYFNQYTPGYNNGEPCHFSMNDVHVSIEESETFKPKYGADHEKNGMKFYDAYALTESQPELKEAVNTLNDKLHSMESVMEAVFGDGVEVIVTADSITVEEYYHD